MTDFLVLENIYKTYKSGNEALEVLKGINAEVKQASSVVITGESGSGKTTLLHLIAAMDSPDSGILRVAGNNIAKANESDLALYRLHTIGLIFQFHYLLKEFTAVENVMIPARMAGDTQAIAREKARALLAEVGLGARENHYPAELSGGERQRVALARALVNNPNLILADEPTGNLDEKNAAMVEELLFSLSKKHGKTLLLVTHNARIAREGDIHWHLAGGSIERGQE